MTRQGLVITRIVACAALVLLMLACVAEWNFSVLLAPEARSYQADYPDALRSGLSPSYALGHLLLIAGFACAASGVVLVCLRRRSGIAPLAASAPAIAAGASLFEYGPAYPSLEPTGIVILWCSAAAAWASAVVRQACASRSCAEDTDKAFRLLSNARTDDTVSSLVCAGCQYGLRALNLMVVQRCVSSASRLPYCRSHMKLNADHKDFGHCIADMRAMCEKDIPGRCN